MPSEVTAGLTTKDDKIFQLLQKIKTYIVKFCEITVNHIDTLHHRLI